MEKIKVQERFGVLEQENGGEENGTEGEAAELDLLPEFCQYRDEGCKLAPACLECPFPSCVEDTFWGRQKQVKNQRDEEIFRQHTVEKVTLREVCAKFKVTRRTVKRILSSRRKKQ